MTLLQDEPFVNANGAVAGFPVGNSALFKLKTKIASRT